MGVTTGGWTALDELLVSIKELSKEWKANPELKPDTCVISTSRHRYLAGAYYQDSFDVLASEKYENLQNTDRSLTEKEREIAICVRSRLAPWSQPRLRRAWHESGHPLARHVSRLSTRNS